MGSVSYMCWFVPSWDLVHSWLYCFKPVSFKPGDCPRSSFVVTLYSEYPYCCKQVAHLGCIAEGYAPCILAEVVIVSGPSDTQAHVESAPSLSKVSFGNRCVEHSSTPPKRDPDTVYHSSAAFSHCPLMDKKYSPETKPLCYRNECGNRKVGHGGAIIVQLCNKRFMLPAPRLLFIDCCLVWCD